MVFIDSNYQSMEDFINLDLDYPNMNNLGNYLTPGSVGASDSVLIKPEDDINLFNITNNNNGINSNVNNNSNNFINNPLINDHLLKIIETQEKQNERMAIQCRLKQVLLDYLKAKQSVPNTPDNNDPTNGSQQTNHMQMAIDGDTGHQSRTLSTESKFVYPMSTQSPPLLTPPISPDIGQQFILNNNSNEMKTNLSVIGLNGNQEVVQTIDNSETIEKFYSDCEEKQLSIEDEEEFEDNNTFNDSFSNYSSYSSANSSTKSNQSSKKRSPVSNRRKQSTTQIGTVGQSDAEQQQQQQKRSAHLSAEFRYRTKLNDKITKLRNIVGPKSQLSKSGVLSRSIDLITKLQKSNQKLKEENKKFRLLLMQAYNQLPTNTHNNTNNTMFIQ